jgi:outer membrane translocation and assembly module TamA
LGLNYQSVKIEESQGRFISDITGKTDSTIFTRKYFAGTYINYEFNTTDNELYPHTGVKLNSRAEFTQNIKESNRNFVRLSSDVTFFVSHRALTAAFRTGVTANLGNDYEFYQSNSLGSSTNLRGFGRSRFSGKTSLYQNTELRYKFKSINGYYFRGNWGLLAFFDNGRVWTPGESSGTWHYGYGGGVWFLPYNKIALTATYGVSKEDKLLNIKTGFFF